MSSQWMELCYLVAAVLFIVALSGLTSARTARRGNALGALGMLIAIIGTLVGTHAVSYVGIIIGLVIGSAVGAVLALKIRMTAVPQLVSFFNGAGGLAAALVTIVEFWHPQLPRDDGVFAAVAGVTSLIGWVTFTGSMIAVAKLQELMTGQPLVFRFQKVLNLVLMLATIVLVVLLGAFPQTRWLLIPVIVIASALGVLVVVPVGGADMPVVIAMLNSLTGLAAAATGFLLGNSGLIISGALVGASGSILTHLMCQAMNRPLSNVLFGSFGLVQPAKAAGERKTVRRYTVEDAEIVLTDSSRVVVIPGYGLAVARAQHVLKELAGLLESRGVTVNYAIHPVAGRMPGHMNVLLAEADVPYGQLLDLDQGNAELEQADVALVVGANDVVNPSARADASSPIYGMPILNADHAKTVMIIKRSLSPGFAGIDNPLFYEDKTMMLFGDAKEVLNELVKLLKT